MHVAAHGVALAAHHQGHLGVGLEPGDTVAHVHADVLQALGPDDVVLFVEPGLQLDQDRDLLPSLRGVRQHARDAGVATGPVERQLDREDVRIVGRGLDEALDRGREAVVRVVQEDVALADHVEDVPRSREPSLGGRVERRVPELGDLQAGEREQVRDVEEAGDLVEVLGGERPRGRLLLLAELGQEQCPERCGHRGMHLDADHLGEPPVPDLLLDQAEEVVGLVVVVDLKVGVPGDPEGVPTQDLDPGEERLEIAPDHLLQRHELVGQEKRHPARQDLGHLHPGEALLAIRAPEHDRERKAQVRDVGERMPWIHRERREDREDVGVEVGVEPGPLVRRYVPESRMEHHPVIGQLRQHLIVKTATVLPDQLPDRRG